MKNKIAMATLTILTAISTLSYAKEATATTATTAMSAFDNTTSVITSNNLTIHVGKNVERRLVVANQKHADILGELICRGSSNGKQGVLSVDLDEPYYVTELISKGQKSYTMGLELRPIALNGNYDLKSLKLDEEFNYSENCREKLDVLASSKTLGKYLFGILLAPVILPNVEVDEWFYPAFTKKICESKVDNYSSDFNKNPYLVQTVNLIECIESEIAK